MYGIHIDYVTLLSAIEMLWALCTFTINFHSKYSMAYNHICTGQDELCAAFNYVARSVTLLNVKNSIKKKLWFLKSCICLTLKCR